MEHYRVIADRLEALRQDILTILTAVATAESVEAELDSAARVLRNTTKEEHFFNRITPGLKLAVFLPSNNLLYSMVLYGFIPSGWGAEIWMRPSSRVKATYFALAEVLKDVLVDAIHFVDETQREFTDRASSCDLVVFTGTPENGKIIASQLGHGPTLLGFGSGPNPVVVGPGAHLGKASHDTVLARMYNGGQDCLCPDIIFVHESIVEDFENRIVQILDRIPAGHRDTRGLVNCPIYYEDAFQNCESFVNGNIEKIRWQSVRLAVDGFVPMTVIRREIRETVDAPELFGPIFNLVSYSKVIDVHEWCERFENRKSGFYISVYGEPFFDTMPIIGNAVNCGPQSALDSEDGNAPFGGFGINASWVTRNGLTSGRPILISSEAAALTRKL